MSTQTVSAPPVNGGADVAKGIVMDLEDSRAGVDQAISGWARMGLLEISNI